MMRKLLPAISMLPFLAAHGPGGKPLTPSQFLNLPDPVQILIYASILFLVILIPAGLLKERLSRQVLKGAFAVMAVTILLSTLYLAYFTVLLNMKSATGGPIHWHADYEVWVCGEKLDLVDPQGFSNYVGDPTIHEHGDNRIHIEGVLTRLQDASLETYFSTIGGEFHEDEIAYPTHGGIVRKGNGDECNGQPGLLYLFINGTQDNRYGEYILSPWEQVPPGDTIKIVFTEKAPEQINGTLGVPP